MAKAGTFKTGLISLLMVMAFSTSALSMGFKDKKLADANCVNQETGYYIVRYTTIAESPEIESRQKSQTCNSKEQAKELVRKLKKSPKFKNARIEPDFMIALPPDEYVGNWSGRTKSIMTWTKQRYIAVELEIFQNGYAKGTVGDAQMQGYVKHNKDRYMIEGKLSGEIIDAEDIKRDKVFIILRNIENSQLKGSFATSGWEIGGKNTMVLSTINMALDRVRQEENISNTDEPNDVNASSAKK